VTLAPGTRTVFVNRYSAEQDNRTQDDEYSESLLFEIESSFDSINITGQALRSPNASCEATITEYRLEEIRGSGYGRCI